jgi:uncharacterized protein (TIGR02246 family)
MTKLRKSTLVIALLFIVIALNAQTPSTPIRNILDQQSAAWNRGDLAQFVLSYAEQCTLVGKQITEVTRAQVLAHYREKYPNSAAMGTLRFSKITVKPLDQQVAVVTGQWHLDRGAPAGGTTGGVFSLVLELRSGEWKIVLDHTS